jgi:Protein of unknown function (DUF3300)
VESRRIRIYAPTSLLMVFSLFVTLSALPGWGQYAPPQPQGQEAPPPPPPPDPGQSPAGEPPQAPPPYIAPQQLDQLVQRIALDPDSLLAQILTASTVWEQIPDAAAWADQHSGLHGDPLAAAIQEDNLQFDPSVMALLPFPQVLDMMAQDPGWTQQLGSAVLAQRGDVMDAVQRDRQQAYAYGYLRTNPYDSVVYDGNYIQILPVNPAYVYVPYYNPAVVYYRPQPGFAVGIGIRFGPAIVVGPAFRPWGWGTVGFAWGAHSIMIDHTPWNRVWTNRAFYAHSYAHPYAHSVGPRVEHHEVRRDEHPR